MQALEADESRHLRPLYVHIFLWRNTYRGNWRIFINYTSHSSPLSQPVADTRVHKGWHANTRSGTPGHCVCVFPATSHSATLLESCVRTQLCLCLPVESFWSHRWKVESGQVAPALPSPLGCQLHVQVATCASQNPLTPSSYQVDLLEPHRAQEDTPYITGQQPRGSQAGAACVGRWAEGPVLSRWPIAPAPQVLTPGRFSRLHPLMLSKSSHWHTLSRAWKALAVNNNGNLYLFHHTVFVQIFLELCARNREKDRTCIFLINKPRHHSEHSQVYKWTCVYLLLISGKWRGDWRAYGS